MEIARFSLVLYLGIKACARCNIFGDKYKYCVYIMQHTRILSS